MIKDLFIRETFYISKGKAVLLLPILLGTFLSSCSLNKRMENKLNRAFKSSKLIEKYHTGFALYDMEKEVMIFQRQADKYFTPASNTKLLTFYAGLKLLPDSIPSLRYINRGDSLIFWGTGDPSFLQSKLKGQKAAEFLKSSPKKLFFAPGRYTGNWYGRGWQWDDYNDYYQAEITELPLMDNLLAVKAKDGHLQVSPALFKDCLAEDTTSIKKEFSITRDFRSNIFRFPKLPVPVNYRQEIPYQTSLASTLAILSDTLGRKIESIDLKMPANAKTIYNMRADSVFKAMLLPSDNFIAEQLLLVCANQIGTDLNTDQTIAYVVKNYFSELPDAPRWVDGSGLSRGNLFTPRAMVKVLELIYKMVNNPQRLYDMLPAGGNRGTLKNAYPKTTQPFVFGKTGTLSNNHNQSGYVLTKKGKTYIYAFMNNNFVVPVADVRQEMARIVTYIHENF
jgi:D-alanyl-D-alanine carboxypeptidase/D-alanyl-D-alanine-endopeptidase (penicillin-binding protein 4)